jgi:DNA-binding transcriptional MerR regulator
VARTIIDPAPGERDRIYSVTELAREFGTTARAIRFYEGKGLLSPNRVGANRVYTHRDRARLVLILRGKRLGFSLREIHGFLSLYHGDHDGLTQMQSLARKLRERMVDLGHQQVLLAETLNDLRRLLNTVETSIKERQTSDADAETVG